MELQAKRAGDIMDKAELPEMAYDCLKHGKYRGKPMSRFGLVLNPQCPACEKELEKEQEKLKETQEKKLKAELEEGRRAKFKKMNIGKKYWEESFETFNPYTPELKRHFDTCVSFANSHQGRMLVMLGNNGNGKDHLAAAILKIIGGYMYSVFEIELLLRQSYSGETREWDIYNRLCGAPLLVINEIGRHKSGEWEANFLSHIINKRYENMGPVILISNKHLKKHCTLGGCGECLEDYLGNDVISRITEGGEIMIFNEGDYRLKLREAKKNAH